MWSPTPEPASPLAFALFQLPLGDQGGLSFLLAGVLSFLGTLVVVLALGYVGLWIWRRVRDSVRFDRREGN